MKTAKIKPRSRRLLEVGRRSRAGPTVSPGLGGQRVGLLLIGFLVPPGGLKNWMLSLLKSVDVHRSAYVGHILMFGVEAITLGPRSRIGPWNLIRGLKELRLDANASIGSFNTLSSAPAYALFPDDGRRARLEVGSETAITNRHYLDCSGGVMLGPFTTLAGVRSTVLSHAIDLGSNRSVVRPVTIGARCFLGSNVSIVPGASIADDIVVGMGSVVAGVLGERGHLYAGVPAKDKGEARNRAYVRRARGRAIVSPDPIEDQE
jgi:acetyltransferase-like isoleucine patch superfamily enzyme